MLENILQQIVCKIICGTDNGTGFLISKNKLLTARHCISDYINEKKEIEIFLNNEKIDTNVHLLYNDADTDVAILEVASNFDVEHIRLSAIKPRQKMQWTSWGFPDAKTSGQFTYGQVANLLSTTVARSDIDLTINPEYSLSNYSGLSGAPVIVDNKIVGILRLQTNNSLNALSICSFTDVLTSFDIDFETDSEYEEVNNGIVVRNDFQNEFETKLLSSNISYMLLIGVHGIGKTTFCREFTPLSTSILFGGTYSLTSEKNGKSTLVKAQPHELYDWLNIKISNLLGLAVPAESNNLNLSKIQSNTFELLQRLSKHCVDENRKVVFFIDAINELALKDSQSLNTLLAVLPISLPNNIQIVFTSNSYETVSNHVSDYVIKNSILILPILTQQQVADYCSYHIDDDLLNNDLIDRVISVAEGHPLYLTYITSYINTSKDTSLANFPVFSGTIENYYENLWDKIISEPESLFLLGIICRLREEIQSDYLKLTLDDSQRKQYISTINQVSHLLIEENEFIAIYHNSFAEFLKSKTEDIADSVNKQLAEFCLNHPDIKYAKLNLIYHLLRSQQYKEVAINSCNQQWVDECVTLGVQPDQLLTDIKQALSSALNTNEDRADSVSTIRLLLLLDRIEFRYNSTFMSNISLTANALISLGKPNEVLNQIIRYDLLLTDPYQTFDIIKSLNDFGYHKQAIKALKTLEDDIFDRFYKMQNTSVELQEYILIYKCLLMVQVISSYILKENRLDASQHIVQSFRSLLDSVQMEESDRLIAVSRVTGAMISSNLILNPTYPKINFDSIKNSTDLLLSLFNALADLYTLSDNNILTVSLEDTFKNISNLLTIKNSIEEHFNNCTLNIFYELNAPNDLINQLVVIYNYSDTHENIHLKLTLDNNVDIDNENIHKYYITKSILYYIKASLDEPQIYHFKDAGYDAFFKSIIENLAYCNGRLKFAKDELEIQSIASSLSALVDTLLFALEDRTDWDNSYSIPEHLAPTLWRYISIIYKRYLPNHIVTLLEKLNSQFDSQFGLYNEGFRRSLNNIISNLIINVEQDSEVEDELFGLLDKWKNYVLEGVENRHELIPELFQLIVYFSQINATGIAEQIYQEILAHSMGPSWYKDNRLTLLTDTFNLIDNSDTTHSSQIIEIANCLERASGEMTFQRYVRQAKDNFVGVLCSKRLYQTAFNYYRRQIAGNISQLKEDVQRGSIDYITPIKGMNYPGGQLIEQDSILQIVSNATDVHWRLKWALLEIFQCGDERYFDRFTIEFANLFNSDVNEIEIKAMLSRLKLIVDTELPLSNRDKFLEKIIGNVSEERQAVLYSFFSFTPSVIEPEDELQVVINNEQDADIESISPNNNIFDPLDSLIPGEIGKSKGHVEAKTLEATVDRYLKRGNTKQAKQEAVKILKTYQNNEWGIWGNNISDTQTFAEKVIISDMPSDEIISLFRELIESENYTPPWRIAEKLISITNNQFSNQQTHELMDVVLKHIQLILGKTNQSISSFNESLTEESSFYSPDNDFLHFLFWLLSHPVYLTATKTATLLHWILGNHDRFLLEAIKNAFSEELSFEGDVLAGIIDVLSNSKKPTIQTIILENINIDKLEHLSRLIILRRILKRRSKELDIKDAIHSIDNKFLSKNQAIRQPTYNYSLNQHLECLSFEIDQLINIGLWNESIESKVMTLLTQQCLPLDIAEAFELENMLCDSFRRPRKTLTTRWEGYVRGAINTVLLPYVILEDAQKVESILRPYNPYAMDSKVTHLPNPLSENVLKALSIKENPCLIRVNNELILNYVESCIPDDSLNELTYNPHRIEVKAIIIQNNQMNFDDVLNRTDYKLFAKDYLQNIETHPLSIYTSVGPSSAFLGSYTPSLPTPQFMEITDTNQSNFSRKVWRNGRTNDSANFGRPYSEGCVLTLKDSNIMLPSNMQLAWMIKINGKLVTIVNQYNQSIEI